MTKLTVTDYRFRAARLLGEKYFGHLYVMLPLGHLRWLASLPARNRLSGQQSRLAVHELARRAAHDAIQFEHDPVAWQTAELLSLTRLKEIPSWRDPAGWIEYLRHYERDMAEHWLAKLQAFDPSTVPPSSLTQLPATTNPGDYPRRVVDFWTEFAVARFMTTTPPEPSVRIALADCDISHPEWRQDNRKTAFHDIIKELLPELVLDRTDIHYCGGLRLDNNDEHMTPIEPFFLRTNQLTP